MQSAHYWRQIESGVIKSTIENFSASRFRALEAPDLPLDEQRRIADFLDDRVGRIDRIIAARRQQLTLLTEQAESAVDRVLDEGDWASAGRLGYFIDSIEQGWSPQCDSIPAGPNEWGVLKVSAVKAGEFIETENKLLPETETPQPDYEIKPGDLLVTRANTPKLVGAFAVAPDDVRPQLILCDKIMRIRLRDLHPDFVALVGQSRRTRSVLSMAGTGTSQSMVNIRGDDIRGLAVPLLTMREQRERVRVWHLDRDAAQTAAKTLTASIDLLTEYKSSLITAAVTGELDVTTASRRIPGE